MSGPARQLKGRAARLGRLMPSGPSTAARTPFVLLVVLLLGGGLITLLLLNSALSEGSFRLSELKKRTTELTDEQQALQHDVDGFSKPDALERRARELGMVPGGSPAFLDPDGKVRGVPVEASAEPTPTPTPTRQPVAPVTTASAGTPAPSSPSAPAGSPGAAAKPGAFANPPAGAPAPADQSPTSPGR
ncbi:septum formation initiator family protein [Streptomyces sp. NPDC014734]|uniref:FtsB family cell division protein n=1 Tax=Streptomyces sp. NPDC014734 TaxID=3364886 RepID=UPI0036FC6244